MAGGGLQSPFGVQNRRSLSRLLSLFVFRLGIEALMSIPWKRLVLAMLFASGLTPAFAQAPASDAALLAKANGGDAPSQVEIGDLCARAAGAAAQAPNRRAAAAQSASDYKQAAEWYRKAAGQGNISGEMRLAALYRDGRGVERDMAQAAEWYRKAAEQGDATAQATLGVLYSMGQGVPHSDVEAYYWLDLAASVKGPDQEKYASNRQMIGTHITADELADVEERVAKWLAAHPR
jgi:TPR repeat protein